MRKLQRATGFSLLEALVALGLIMIVTAFAIIQSFGSMESYRANASMDAVISQMRVARQLAISQRRNVVITFGYSSPQTITYKVIANAGDVNVPAPVTVPISQQVNFTGVTGESDTPMGFGTCGSQYGVCIANTSGGPPSGMYFTAVGQFTDSTFVNPLNGTIFLAIPNQISTARAVTIMGSTGRVRSYSYIGSNKWTE